MQISSYRHCLQTARLFWQTRQDFREDFEFLRVTEPSSDWTLASGEEERTTTSFAINVKTKYLLFIVWGKLFSILEKDINVFPRLPASPHSTVQIIDGMAIVQMTKSGGCTTFGELAGKYYDIFTATLSSNICAHVHVIFDQYWDISIKGGERQRRGKSSAFEVNTGGPSTPIPKQWGMFNANPKNKVGVTSIVLFSSKIVWYM